MDIPSCSGKTFLELLIVLALVSVLWGVASAPMGRLMSAQQVQTHQHLLHAHLNLARHGAVTSGYAVVVCPRTGNACAAGSGDWSEGWLVFEDFANENQCDVDPERGVCTAHGGRVLAVAEPVRQVQVVSNRNVARRVRFNTMGMSYGYTGRFSICDRRALASPRGLVVAQSGRVRRASASELLPCTR
ncbi:GspH/FimT family pseudopilin [Isoalcanivorax indicus]|uniref:GspH/FimT family pseudopilin n=1 Tax=Isoalcanivorax indicus TaxID=2202653 RepID=UPI000DBAA0E1|nr:GspH/FimT family pseudopilin [Isoalcanivorax indicus]